MTGDDLRPAADHYLVYISTDQHVPMTAGHRVSLESLSYHLVMTSQTGIEPLAALHLQVGVHVLEAGPVRQKIPYHLQLADLLVEPGNEGFMGFLSFLVVLAKEGGRSLQWI